MKYEDTKKRWSGR